MTSIFRITDEGLSRLDNNHFFEMISELSNVSLFLVDSHD